MCVLLPYLPICIYTLHLVLITFFLVSTARGTQHLYVSFCHPWDYHNLISIFCLQFLVYSLWLDSLMCVSRQKLHLAENQDPPKTSEPRHPQDIWTGTSEPGHPHLVPGKGHHWGMCYLISTELQKKLLPHWPAVSSTFDWSSGWMVSLHGSLKEVEDRKSVV